ncbi:fibroblast growth factor 23-like [Genypterus blacodes]|uniref:fibroblast growth factor 23-like n=1 Tax=Genypterus blacodes TaxID=154954 RepID=UPI003F776E66
MQPALFLLFLVAVHVCVPADCRLKLGRSHVELSGSMRKAVPQDPLVILPVRTKAGNFVSIFDLKRKWFVCLDLKGELYNSRQMDRQDCLFQRIRLDVENHRDVLYSTNGGRLLKLDRAEGQRAPRESPAPLSGVLERFLGSLVKRRKRSDDVNPSDPLRSESHPTLPVKDHQDTDQGKLDQTPAGAVSKETITSCDDPLQVLHPNGPVSPVKENIVDRTEQD